VRQRVLRYFLNASFLAFLVALICEIDTTLVIDLI